ncbi:MAG: TolC family protein [Gemmatimonadales bacterium]|nr:TolC family protein [Gemmatimonadales bacterium]NIN12092.1 TolC family protein [Gemmatimonadales bacterium]NIR03327.1 TolC family protein [Gemmatimonadales bacterium]NIS67007.1 TolC family protein [Gemmatimonadales bacterium]
MALRSLGRVTALWVALAASAPAALHSQLVSDNTPLDSLIQLAVQANPDLKAMEARAAVFEARIGPAGAWDDPQLMVGFMNLPLPSFDFDGTPMTQAATVQLRQTIFFPGKQGLREDIAVAEYETVLAEATDKRFAIVSAVRAAYYDLYTLERSLEITQRHEALLQDFVRVANARYTVGSGLQQDVLKANVEQGRVRERLLQQLAQREAAAARLNALVNRRPEAPVAAPALPSSLVRLAFAPRDTAGVRFARSVEQEPPIPSLSALVDSAIAQRPLLAAHRSAIERQQHAIDLARKNLWPNLTVSLGYGLRGAGLADLLSANIGFSLPIFAGRKQNQLIDAAKAGEVRAEAAYQAAVNRIAARLADLRAHLVRLGEQLILYRDGIVPQATAALQSATSAYQVGRVDFLTLVNSEATLYRYELEYHRLLASFLRTAADIEWTVGREIFSQ